LREFELALSVVAVTKDEHHRAKKIIGDRELVDKYKEAIVLVNSESHRYVIGFHRARRAKDFLK
jgi:excinuclease UvrABC nuclease subunit